MGGRTLAVAKDSVPKSSVTEQNTTGRLKNVTATLSGVRRSTTMAGNRRPWGYAVGDYSLGAAFGLYTRISPDYDRQTNGLIYQE